MRHIELLNQSVAQFILDYDRYTEDRDNAFGLYSEFSDFEKNHKSRTTNKIERNQRISFLNKIIESVVVDGNE